MIRWKVYATDRGLYLLVCLWTGWEGVAVLYDQSPADTARARW